MKKQKITIIIVWLIIVFLIWIVFYNKSISGTSTPEICINNTCFDIEIADTPQERQLWLMYREQLPELSGMLFIFEKPGQYNFWMKNTLISLDMIWIDNQNKIVDIKQATPCTTDPCPTYNPQWSSSYVLELNIWISKKYKIKIWDTVKIKK